MGTLPYIFFSVIENIGDKISLGKLEIAAKRFNKLPNNILLIKLVFNSSNLKISQKLLEFVDLVEGYEQKILMTMMLYTEFMKSIDVTLLPQLQATIVKEMSEFEMLNSFYQDQFKTMKSVLKALDEKVEAFIPEEEPELKPFKRIDLDSLRDIMQRQKGKILHILPHKGKEAYSIYLLVICKYFY